MKARRRFRRCLRPGGRSAQRLSVRYLSAFDIRASDVIPQVRPPTLEEADSIKEGARLISYIYPAREKELVAKLQERKATVIGE